MYGLPRSNKVHGIDLKAKEWDFRFRVLSSLCSVKIEYQNDARCRKNKKLKGFERTSSVWKLEYVCAMMNAG
jgi:hypothetical protein